jgi:mannose-6-phosphate isomerase-like protein (cupin superfamily)
MPKAIRNIAFSMALVFIASVSVTFVSGQAGGKSQAVKGELQYAKNIFYDVKPVPPEMAAMMKQMQEKSQSTVEGTRIVDLDTTRAEGAPYMDFVWLWKGSAKGYSEDEHYHNFDEVIGFIGSKGENNPRDLGGEMEVWLGGEKYLITRSCLIFVPKGLKHCPIRFNRIDSPVFFFSFGMATKYSRTATKFEDTRSAERNYAPLISYGINFSKVSPATMKRMGEMERKARSTVQATRLLDLDQIGGSFYADFVWLWRGSAKGYSEVEHSHDFDEVIAFMGAKGQKKPHDLGGEMEVWLGGEKHLINKSCLIWVPKGLKHCPIRFNRIDSPILFFTVGNVEKYSSIVSKQQ